MKKLIAFLAVLTVFGLATAAQAGVSYVATDTVTNDAWRTASVAKANDVDGDNIYGTDGWAFYSHVQTGYQVPYNGASGNTQMVIPSYVSSIDDPVALGKTVSGWGGGASGNYGVIDDPLNPVSNHNCTFVFADKNHGGQELRITIHRSTSKAFRLTVFQSIHSGAAAGQGFDVRVTDDAFASYAQTFLSYDTAWLTPNYMIFDVSAGTSDVTISALNAPGVEHAGIMGFALDSTVISEPAGLGLLGVALLGLRRRRA